MILFDDEQSKNRSYGNSQILLYDNSPLYISVHRRDEFGQIILNAPLAYFNQLKLQAVAEPDSSMTQILLTDAPSIYAFAPEHRLFTFTCTLEDTLLDPTQQAVQNRTGRGFSDWRSFYNNEARIDICASKNRLVRLMYDGTITYGAITEMVANHDAANPNIYAINFTVYVLSDLGF